MDHIVASSDMRAGWAAEIRQSREKEEQRRGVTRPKEDTRERPEEGNTPYQDATSPTRVTATRGG